MRFATKFILCLVGIVAFFEVLLLVIFAKEDISLPRDTTLTERGHGNYQNDLLLKHKSVTSQVTAAARKPAIIHVAVVVCGNRAEQATTMLKSITLFTKRQLKFHILAEDQLHGEIQLRVDQWPPVKDGQVEYKIYSLSFPTGKSKADWKKLFKPCASQRLFLPTVLSGVDSLLYLDTDTLVLRPIEDIWNHFKHFNSTQLAALTPEGEVPALNWYSRFAMHPYYGKLGVNSGVMLMNLTRMRAFNMEDKIVDLYMKYKLKITWGDQDLLNILFHYHPELLYILGCEWNYRPDHCMYGNNCNTAITQGITVLHGNRGVFHTRKGHPEFKAIYDSIQEFHHGDNGKESIKSLKAKLEPFVSTYCGKMRDAFLKHPMEYVKKQLSS